MSPRYDFFNVPALDLIDGLVRSGCASLFITELK